MTNERESNANSIGRDDRRFDSERNRRCHRSVPATRRSHRSSSSLRRIRPRSANLGSGTARVIVFVAGVSPCSTGSFPASKPSERRHPAIVARLRGLRFFPPGTHVPFDSVGLSECTIGAPFDLLVDGSNGFDVSTKRLNGGFEFDDSRLQIVQSFVRSIGSSSTSAQATESSLRSIESRS